MHNFIILYVWFSVSQKVVLCGSVVLKKSLMESKGKSCI